MAFDAAAARFDTPLGAPSMRLPAADSTVPTLAPTIPAPLRPMQRAWLRGWSAHLDPRRHPSVSGSALVSAVLRSVPSARDEQPTRSLAAWPAIRPAPPRVGAPTLEPRSMGGHLGDGGAPRRRTAELLAALASGLDAAEGRVSGHSIRTALIATRLAEALELTEQNRAALLYAGLLRDAGTTGRAPAPNAGARPARPPAHQPAHLSRPDRAAAVITSLGLPPAVAEAVCSVDERWDGKGPLRQRHDIIPTGARVLAVASAAADAVGRTLATVARGTPELGEAARRAAEGALHAQRGHELDPLVVDTAARKVPGTFWKRLVEATLMDQLLEAEPAGDIRRSTPEHIDTVCSTFADLVDTRTPMMGRHGARVADLATKVAGRMGFDPLECREVRRAGLLHDIGKLLVPIAYLEKAADLTEAERAVIRDHARVGAEILRRSRVLAGLAPLVAGHHEALDGDGAFPEFTQSRMALAARILAVCDRYEAMTSERPYRPLLSTEQVWHLLEEAATEPLARQAFLALQAVIEGD
jgi:putative nucleotidyltransferase with HDIG domain